MTAYTLTLAGLLLVAGALGDQLGRRRVLTVGVIWFAARALQGWPAARSAVTCIACPPPCVPAARIPVKAGR